MYYTYIIFVTFLNTLFLKFTDISRFSRTATSLASPDYVH